MADGRDSQRTFQGAGWIVGIYEPKWLKLKASLIITFLLLDSKYGDQLLFILFENRIGGDEVSLQAEGLWVD